MVFGVNSEDGNLIYLKRLTLCMLENANLHFQAYTEKQFLIFIVLDSKHGSVTCFKLDEFIFYGAYEARRNFFLQPSENLNQPIQKSVFSEGQITYRRSFPKIYHKRIWIVWRKRPKKGFYCHHVFSSHLCVLYEAREMISKH